uniref:Uncharacterized protein n=1 Tax=Arundo donax TaxID=35708 RepID=A0A0A9I3E0_ARUDO
MRWLASAGVSRAIDVLEVRNGKRLVLIYFLHNVLARGIYCNREIMVIWYGRMTLHYPSPNSNLVVLAPKCPSLCCIVWSSVYTASSYSCDPFPCSAIGIAV